MSKKVMILDVEGISGKKPYNIGYIIGDNKGNIFMERSFALPNNFWENLQNCFNAREMTHKNLQEILSDFGAGDMRKYEYISNVDFISIFENDLKIFNVKEIDAYNCNFDKSSIRNLYENRIMPDVEWCDIWSEVVYSRCLTKKYVKFCKENGFVTDKGNIKTSAEVVYSYMTKNITFCEEHTGLADCGIEYELYLWAKSSKKKMVKKHPRQIWKVMAELVEKMD